MNIRASCANPKTNDCIVHTVLPGEENRTASSWCVRLSSGVDIAAKHTRLASLGEQAGDNLKDLKMKYLKTFNRSTMSKSWETSGPTKTRSPHPQLVQKPE
ncbi:hypothetical protein [Gimesia maris]|uniref:hypothetical protein n=1 Tax=Gimesia maris TaxID=122 RepID=UPI00241F5701|nr:hypothetical protein [Gimesia maris]|tara:strand:- start:5096 stop:5398 length:303 start_codon:yes stop_codon:yes gene_type:complete